MNKKFSTLMAGLMLASAFSVASAQTVVEKYETDKTYWLGTGTGTGTSVSKVIAVVSNPKATNYGQLILVDPSTELTTINEVKAATWTIVFTQPTDGTAPKFTYVNKATGLTLSLDPNAAGDVAMIKGSSSEWLNTPITNADTNPTTIESLPFAPLRSFYEANKAVFLYEDGNDLKVGVSTNTSDLTYEGNSAIEIAPAQPAIFPLNANDLNSQLGKLDLSVVSNDQKWFNLYFNQDVTEGAETNLFAATPLQASQLYQVTSGDNNDLSFDSQNGTRQKSPYVRLTAKDKDGAYITVDTAYHKGTENVAKLPKFTYAKSNYEGTNNVARSAESSYFAFAYNPFTDQILIKSRGYYTYNAGPNNTPIEITNGADGNKAYTYWGYSNATTADQKVINAYVRLAKLASVRELTVGPKPTDNAYQWTEANDPTVGMATTVTMSLKDQTFSPATIADGLYMIKLHTSGYDKDGNKRDEADGDYLIASLAGNFGYAEQAKNQNYDHMPAAQWYVKQNGTSATSPVSIKNREFFDVDVKENLQLFNAGDGRVFFTVGAFANDTLEFIPVSDASKADSKLGYKYVDEKQASVETYYFNYLSGLALDKGLNTPSTKDSLVRVDETGEKIALRLVPVTKDDSYGIQLDEKKTGIANLVRNATTSRHTTM